MKKTILMLTLLLLKIATINAQAYPEMIAVEGASFIMGDDLGYDNEQPAHMVTLKNFSIAKTETTVLQWKTYCNATGHVLHAAPSGSWKDNHPITNVSWEQADAYCKWLSKKTGSNYQLPTEQQWEYAARGGNKTHLYEYSGGEKVDNLGWYFNNSNGGTNEVASKKKNELGINDMSGNVYEWCNDLFAEYPNGIKKRPGALQSEKDRVLRGGGWESKTNACRVTSRDRLYPNRTASFIGFRIAITEAIDNNVMDTKIGAGDYFGKLDKEYEEIFLVPDMVLVKGGSFNMGSLNGEASEKPVHKVTLNSFKIAKYEVTVLQYKLFCKSVGNEMPDRAPEGGWKDGLPIGDIDYEHALAYCTWLSNKYNKKYRLPTEAEWEYAARGGDNSAAYTYSGSNNLNEVSWNQENSGKITHQTGLKKANELGLYDMSGNVEEWCSDWYEEYNRKDQTNPKGQSKSKLYRVMRGGTSYFMSKSCTVSAREYRSPNSNYPTSGFRIVEDEY